MTDKEILGTSTITYKYQITIPKRVRSSCNFKKGDLLVFEREGDRIYIKNGNDP